jgi:hypothetical protein
MQQKNMDNPDYYKKFFNIALSNYGELSFKSIKNIVKFLLGASKNKIDILM